MTEQDCYPGVIEFFNEFLVPRFKPKLGFSAVWTLDTSLSTGDSETAWSRPDVTSLIVARGKYASQSQLTLISGEVKLRSGANIQAVHQALAQSRYTHCAYLICESAARKSSTTKDLIIQCERLGLGFATFVDPNDLSSFDIHAHATRREPHLDDLDHYIETRVDEHHQDKLRACLAPTWGYE